MEKRVSRILTQFDVIVEEINSLRDNLELLFTHVVACVEHVKGESEISHQKDVLSYELDILKKINEINYFIEELIEQRPSSTLSVSVSRTNLSTIKEHSSSSCQNNKIFNTDTSLAESDIQYLKNTLKKFSEKLGLGNDVISSTNNFYNEPSTSYVRNLYTNLSAASTSEANIENFEIPEKDTNTKCKVELSYNGDIFSEVEPVCTSRVEESGNGESESIIIQDEVVESSDENVSEVSSELLMNENVLEVSTQLLVNENVLEVSTQLLVNENESDVPSQLLKHDDVCTNENVSEVPCQLFINESVSEAPCHLLLNKNATEVLPQITEAVVQSEVDVKDETDNSIEALVNTTKTTNVLSSALDKLNNYSCDRQEVPALLRTEPLQLPNIMLKPTDLESSSIHKNVQETSNALRKKRNKKKNGNSEDKVHYELHQKAHPKIGDKCAFSHVESPSEFYIHIVDDESALIDMLTEQINEYFIDSISEYNIKEVAHNAIGRYCFVYILDYNGWYRAEVLNWFLGKKTDEVLVLLVDYGNKRFVSYRNLRNMIREIAEIPILAIKCHFPLMYPPGSTALYRKTEWPPETIDAIVNLSGLLAFEDVNKVFVVVFAQYCTELNSVAIDLFNPDNANDEITFGQILLDLQLCEQIVDSIEDCDTNLEVFLQDVDTLENAANINEAITEYDPKDEARICRFTKPDGTCYKGKNCKLEHIALPKDGFTTDKDPVYREAMYDLILPLPNEAIRILITGYVDICNFYAQIIRTPHQEKKYMLDKTLYILLEDMNCTKVIRTYEPFRVPPTVGEIVMTKHYLSKKWLRAVVQDLIDENDDEVHVFTVDFGDYLKVKLSDLRKIKPNFLKLPFQAVNCYIGDYKFKKNCVHTEAKTFFFKNLYFNNFIAHSLSSSLPMKIRLQSMNGFDIGKELEKHGFAEKRIYDRNPCDDCLLKLY